MTSAVSNLPSHTKVVVIGGGMMGVSLLYHLALEGWKDVVLLEKGELTSGSTWHAAGQVPSLAGNYNIAKIHHYANMLYPKLEEMTGQYVSWHGCGGIRFAATQEEVDWFKYIAGYSKSIGFHYEVIPPELIREKHPYVGLDGVLAGAWTTQDGHVDPAGACNAVAIAARNLGAKIFRNTLVTGLFQKPNGEWIVQTGNGDIVAEHVVNSAGCYAAQVGAMVGLDVPVINMQHQYLVTEPVPEVIARDKELPALRDPLTSGYYRQEQKSYLIGIYEHYGAQEAWEDRGGYPQWESSSELFSPDLDRISPWLSKVMERMPILANLGIRRVVNGAITHTPDGMPLLGPAEGLRNFWMCCGSAIGIAQGPGCGLHLARWMVHGDTDISMREFDSRRYSRYADRDYTRAKVFEDFQRMFTVHLPGEELMAGRPKTTSPLYAKLRAKGAVFGESFGWERAKFFPSDGRETHNFRRTSTFDAVGNEARSVRSNAGIIDLSSFSKYEVRGAEAQSFLDRFVMNRLPRRIGGIGLAHPLSTMGRIQSEFTITKLAEDHYYLASAAASRVRDIDLLNGNKREGESVDISDVTDEWGVLVLAGPKSRTILDKITDNTLDSKSFPWLTAKVVEVAGIQVRALRINYVGELGWELHVPIQSLESLYDSIFAVGQESGLADFGLYALDSMRLEKAYRGWGTELSSDATPLEAGLDRFIDFNKSFVGKEAILRQKVSGPERQLGLLRVDTLDSDPRGNEPIFLDGKLAGVTTSGGFGHVIGKSLAFAYLRPDAAAPGTHLTLDLLGDSFAATVLDGAPFDAGNDRLRS